MEIYEGSALIVSLSAIWISLRSARNKVKAKPFLIKLSFIKSPLFKGFNVKDSLLNKAGLFYVHIENRRASTLKIYSIYLKWDGSEKDNFTTSRFKFKNISIKSFGRMIIRCEPNDLRPKILLRKYNKAVLEINTSLGIQEISINRNMAYILRKFFNQSFDKLKYDNDLKRRQAYSRICKHNSKFVYKFLEKLT